MSLPLRCSGRNDAWSTNSRKPSVTSSQSSWELLVMSFSSAASSCSISTSRRARQRAVRNLAAASPISTLCMCSPRTTWQVVLTGKATIQNTRALFSAACLSGSANCRLAANYRTMRSTTGSTRSSRSSSPHPATPDHPGCAEQSLLDQPAFAAGQSRSKRA